MVPFIFYNSRLSLSWIKSCMWFYISGYGKQSYGNVSRRFVSEIVHVDRKKNLGGRKKCSAWLWARPEDAMTKRKFLICFLSVSTNPCLWHSKI